MTKKFKLDHFLLTWHACVEIDEEKAKPAIKEMVEFWGGWEGRLRQNSGDYTKTFMEQLAVEMLHIVISERCGIRGVLQVFESREGWCKMDGSQGIKIINCGMFEFESDDFQIKELK